MTRSTFDDLIAKPILMKVGLDAEHPKELTIKPLPLRKAKELIEKASELFSQSDIEDLQDEAKLLAQTQAFISESFEQIAQLLGLATDMTADEIQDGATLKQAFAMAKAVIEVNGFVEVMRDFFSTMKEFAPSDELSSPSSSSPTTPLTVVPPSMEAASVSGSPDTTEDTIL